MKPEKYDQKTYENEQIQRHNERMIRHWKKRVATLEAGGVDAIKARKKVAEWQAIQRNHLAATGLTRMYEREKIAKGVESFNSQGIIKLSRKSKNALIKKDFNEIVAYKAKLSDLDARDWYNYHDKRILDLIDKSLPLEQQSRNAHELRNLYRTQSRVLMGNQDKRKALDEERPNLTFDEMLEYKRTKYSLIGEAAYLDIIRSSRTTNSKVNKKVGVKDEDV